MTYFLDATITGVYEALDPARDWVRVRAALKVKCPWCRARPHQPCHSQGAPLSRGDRIHPARADLAARGGS